MPKQHGFIKSKGKFYTYQNYTHYRWYQLMCEGRHTLYQRRCGNPISDYTYQCFGVMEVVWHPAPCMGEGTVGPLQRVTDRMLLAMGGRFAWQELISHMG